MDEDVACTGTKFSLERRSESSTARLTTTTTDGAAGAAARRGGNRSRSARPLTGQLPEAAAAGGSGGAGVPRTTIEAGAVHGQTKYEGNKSEAASGDRAMLLEGPLDYRHMYINMSGLVVSAGPFTRAGVTCPAALGFSFAAGTTDGECVYCGLLFLCFRVGA